MPYNLSISDDNTMIIIKVDGNVNSNMALEYSMNAYLLAKDKGILCFLIDLTNARNQQTIAENYDFMNLDLDESGFVDRRAKIAMLVSPEDHSHDFVEKIARIMGHNILLCRKMDDAITFLKH